MFAIAIQRFDISLACPENECPVNVSFLIAVLSLVTFCT